MIYFKPHPFKRYSEAIHGDAETLADVSTLIAPHSVEHSLSVNGDIVVPREWATTPIKSTDTVIAYAVPQGGGNIGNILAFAAATLNPAFVAGFAVSFAITQDFDASVQTGTALGFGPLSPIANRAILGKPGSASTPSAGRSDPLVNSITGAGNQVDPFGVIPKVYGKIRVFPKLPGKYPTQYTEIVGDDQYLRALFLVCKGPVTITDIKIGDTAIGSFTDVQTEVLEGKAGDPALTLYTRDIFEDAFSLALTQAGGWQTRTTAIDADHISVDWTFPSGIQLIQKDGDRKGRSVAVEIEYKLTPLTSWTSLGTFNTNGKTTSAIRKNHSWDVAKGQYDVRIRRNTADEGSREVGATFWTALRTIRDETPVLESDVALIALRIKATDQLNGLIGNLNCLVESELQSYNGSSWVAAAATRNPAWAVADILTGNGNRRPLAQARLDGDSFKAFADFCISKGFEFNHIFDDDGNLFIAANIAARVGRGTLDNVDGKYFIVFDDTQAAVKQHFTPRNSWGIEGRMAYPDTPHGFRVGFRNSALDYQEDERVVFDDGYNAGNATKYDFVQYPGVTLSDQAWKLGRFEFAALRLRFEEWEFTTDLEHMIVTRGDLAVLAHDAILIGLGWGRVTTVNTSGTDVVSIVIDALVTMETAKSYGVQIRKTTGNIQIEEQINNPVDTVSLLTFTTPIPNTTDQPSVGDLVLFGEWGQISQRVIVKSIRPTRENGNLAARLTVTPEAAGVYTADTGTIPTHTPIISINSLPANALPPTPTIGTIRSDETVALMQDDGSFSAQMVIPLSITGNFTPASVFFQLQYRVYNTDVDSAEPWITSTLVDGANGEIKIQDVEVLLVYEIRARSLNKANASLVSPWTSSVTHTVLGDTLPPDAPTSVVASAGDKSANLTWVNPTDGLGGTLIDFCCVEIWRHTSNDSAGAAFSAETAGESFVDGGLTNGTQYFYWLRARDFAGNLSAFHTTQFAGAAVTPSAGAADTTPPATPTGLALTPGGVITNDGQWATHIVADWTDNVEGDLAGYHVEYRETGDTETTILLVVASTIFIGGLLPNTSYDVRVRAFDTSGNTSAFTAYSTDSTPENPGIPATPTGLTATAFPLAIGLSWNLNAEADVIQYELQRADDSGFTVNVVTLTKTLSLSYVDDLGPNVQRWYRLRAIRRTGIASAFTAIVNATTAGVASTELADSLALVEIVSSLPVTGNFEGRTAYLTTDNKLYRYDGGSWIAAVAAVDVTGTLGTSQIADDAITQLKVAAGAIGETELASLAVTAAKIATDGVTSDKILANAVTSAKIAASAVTNTELADLAVTIGKFGSGVKPLEVLGSLPAAGTQGRVVFLTTDNKLYRDTGTVWVETIPSTDITGTLGSSQIADNAVTSAKIAANAVTSSELADLAVTIGKFGSGVKPLEVLGSLPAAGTQGRVVFLTTDNKLYRDTGTVWVETIPSTDITGTLTGSQIADNAITSAKVAAGAIDTSELASASVTATELATNAVTETKISSNAISSAKIQANAITSGLIAAAAVIAGKIAAGAVSTTELAADAVTAAKIAAGTITASEIASNTITAGQIAAGAIAASELATDSVTSVKIAAGAIVAGKIAAGAVDTTELAADAVTAAKIAAGTITAAEIAANTITAGQIAAGAIAASELATNSVTSTKIAAGAVIAGKIAADAITATEIAASAVTSGAIAAGAVIAGKIAAGSITATELAANSVTASAIVANAVTSSEIAANAITASEISANAVTFGKIAAGAVRANEINSASINSTHLTTGTLLTNTAQIQSGLINSAHIGSAAITTAKIGDLQVNTIKISNNAVTNNGEVFGATWNATVTGTGFSTVTPGINYTGSGGSILIIASCMFARETDADSYWFRLWRQHGNATLVDFPDIQKGSGAQGKQITMSVVDSYTGNANWWILARKTSSGTKFLQLDNIKIIILETLR
jgi:hypothetical protein